MQKSKILGGDMWPLHSKVHFTLVKGQTTQIHFTLEGEGPETKRNYHGWEIYVEFEMKCEWNGT